MASSRKRTDTEATVDNCNRERSTSVATRSVRTATIDKYSPVFSITLGLVFEDEYGLNFEAYKNPLFWRAVVGEFIGSIFFLFFTISSVIASDGDIMVVSSCFGSVILILIYSLQDTSGAHFNPAVTFAGAISNELSVVRGVTYMVAQCGGCIIGVALVHAMAPTRLAAYNGGANIVKRDIAPGGAFIGEIVCTTLFILVVLFATGMYINMCLFTTYIHMCVFYTFTCTCIRICEYMSVLIRKFIVLLYSYQSCYLLLVCMYNYICLYIFIFISMYTNICI
jgi:glycerol uptake facilitator-like aquaporin